MWKLIKRAARWLWRRRREVAQLADGPSKPSDKPSKPRSVP